MPVSRLLGGAKLIEPQKGIQITGKSRISQFTDFARMIMDRYLVKSVYEISSASFVFADWFQGGQDSEEKKSLERELIRILRFMREIQRERRMPAVYQQLMQQLNRTIVLYENRLDRKSEELLALCSEVLRQGDRAAEYLQQPELERRLNQVMMQLAGPGRTQVFTGRFSSALEERVRAAGQIPPYRERFLKAKQESTERFREVYTERLPMIRFIERMNQEEKRQLQILFPMIFEEGREPVNVLTSMSGRQWGEWKKQVLQMFFPEPEEQDGGKMASEPQGLQEHFVEQARRRREWAAGQLAFLSVFSENGQTGPLLESVLTNTENEWEQTERVFLELSGGKEVEQLQMAYQETKERILEKLRQNQLPEVLKEMAGQVKQINVPGDVLAPVWERLTEEDWGKAETVLLHRETGTVYSDWKQRLVKADSGHVQSETQAIGYGEQEERTATQKELAERFSQEWNEHETRERNEHESWERIRELYVSEKELYTHKVMEQNGVIPKEMLPVLGKAPFLLVMQKQEDAEERLFELFRETPELELYAGGLSAQMTRQQKMELIQEAIASLDVREWELLERRLFEKAEGRKIRDDRRTREATAVQETGAIRKSADAERLLELMRTSFSEEEYRLKKQQFSEQVLKEAGGIPADMQPVLGKQPLIQMIQESEETAGYVFQMMNQIPEMEIYTKSWQTLSQQSLAELIETLVPSEWSVVEERLLHGNMRLPEPKPAGRREAASESETGIGWKFPKEQDWLNPSDAVLNQLHMPAASAMEFLNLFVHDTYDRHIWTDTRKISGKQFGPDPEPGRNRMAGAGSESERGREPGIPGGEAWSVIYPGVNPVFTSGGLHAVLSDSGVFAYPIPDQVIARPIPPKGIPSPAQNAQEQLRQLREQPAGELAEEDIHTVQVMGNQVRTVNEYEERLTKLTEQITAQKREMEELMKSQRQMSDPHMQRDMIERMMRQLGKQLRLERMQRGND